MNPAGPIMPDGTPADGCTAWPDGPWRECCLEHDWAYRSEPGLIRRRAADVQLMRCVARSGYPGIAVLMFFGIRAFGWIPWHANYRRWVGKKVQEVRAEKWVGEL